MSLSEVIASVIEPLFDLMPQVHHRPATNQFGVADSWGREPRLFSGPLLHIPAVTHVEIYPASEWTLDTGLQSLTTADRKLVSVNATAIVRISEPLQLRTVSNVDGWHEWVAMTIWACVQEVISDHNWSQSLTNASEMIEEDAYHPLSLAGVELIQLVLEDSTECFPVRLLQPF